MRFVASMALLMLASGGCLGHAGDAQRAASDPGMNEARKPSKEPMPGSVTHDSYGEEYPQRRK
jgi:hypothetical protein